jgi:hypothetical protein
MKFQYIRNVLVFLLFLIVHPVWSQESEKTTKQKKSGGFQLSDQDVILPISSIEWGTPDRWSITSRYMHIFEKNRRNESWLSITLSPGISGGRLGIGYTGILKFQILNEVRVVLLRTWGNPLSTVPNRTFVGAEFRISADWIFIGIGYYMQISDSKSDREQFFGFHFGIGI